MSSFPIRPIPQAFTLKYPGLSNRIISEVHIWPYSSNGTPLLGTGLKTTALWDTGATQSIITQRTAKELRLVPIGKSIINHGGGQSEHNTYMVNIRLPNAVMVGGVHVTALDKILDNFGAIIGMDIIASGDFCLTHLDGQTCFSFRIPSICQIDYVSEIEDKIRKIRGHDQCLCGSKKQYRKCHQPYITQSGK